jgi:uncharacterized protein (DUF58 family)
MALWVFLLALAAYAGGVGTGWPLLQHVAYALVLLEAACYLFAFFARQGLTLHSTFDTLRVTAGDEVIERITARKEGWFPAPWVEIVSPEGLTEALGVWGDEERSWHRTRLFPNRGHFVIGNDEIRVRDPFGLFALAGPRLPHTPVTVYPRPVVTSEAVVAGSSLAASTSRRQWERDDASIGDLRPYVAGDPPTRIHWRSSARTGTLVVTDHESRRRRTTWLLVDLCGDDETADHTAGIAAYLAERLWEQGQELGAVVAGEQIVVIPPKRTREQTSRVLEPLATVEATDDSRMEDLIRAAARCEQRDALVVITPAAHASSYAQRMRRLAPTVRIIPGEIPA